MSKIHGGVTPDFAFGKVQKMGVSLMKNGQSFLKFNYLIFAFISCMVLVGCSSSKEEDSNSNNDDKTTITFWHPMDTETSDAMESVIDLFEEKNPDIKVDATYI